MEGNFVPEYPCVGNVCHLWVLGGRGKGAMIRVSDASVYFRDEGAKGRNPKQAEGGKHVCSWSNTEGDEQTASHLCIKV